MLLANLTHSILILFSMQATVTSIQILYINPFISKDLVRLRQSLAGDFIGKNFFTLILIARNRCYLETGGFPSVHVVRNLNIKFCFFSCFYSSVQRFAGAY